jgi:hypothetical protein
MFQSLILSKSDQKINYTIEPEFLNGNSLRLKLIYDASLTNRGIEFKERNNMGSYAWSDEVIRLYNRNNPWIHETVIFNEETNQLENAQELVIHDHWLFCLYGRFQTKNGINTFTTFVPWGISVYHDSKIYNPLDKLILKEGESYKFLLIDGFFDYQYKS